MKNTRGMGVPPQIHFHVHFSVDTYETAFAREQDYDKYRLTMQTKRLPLLWGEKEPSLGGHQVSMYLETETDNTIAVKWTGNLSAFAGLHGISLWPPLHLRDETATSQSGSDQEVFLPTFFSSPGAGAGLPAFCLGLLATHPCKQYLDARKLRINAMSASKRAS